MRDWFGGRPSISQILMLIIIGKHLKEAGEGEKAVSQFKIAQKIIDAFKEDFLKKKYFKSTIYEYVTD